MRINTSKLLTDLRAFYWRSLARFRKRIKYRPSFMIRVLVYRAPRPSAGPWFDVIRKRNYIQGTKLFSRLPNPTYIKELCLWGKPRRPQSR